MLEAPLKAWGWGRGTNIYRTVINASSLSRPRLKGNGTTDFDNPSEEISSMFRFNQFISLLTLETNMCALSWVVVRSGPPFYTLLKLTVQIVGGWNANIDLHRRIWRDTQYKSGTADRAGNNPYNVIGTQTRGTEWNPEFDWRHRLGYNQTWHPLSRYSFLKYNQIFVILLFWFKHSKQSNIRYSNVLLHSPY